MHFWLTGKPVTQSTRRVAPRHRHEEGQIFGIERGVMVFHTRKASWLVGPGQVIWLPPRLDHDAHSHGAVAGWSLYLGAERCASLPCTPFLARGTTLLNAQAARLARNSRSGDPDMKTIRLAETFWDEFFHLPRLTLSLPLPADERLRRVADRFASDPADRRPQEAWAAMAGMSLRSFIRHFKADTGLGFAAWQQRLRLLVAREHLARGERVTSVALATGYESPGAFSSAFTRATGIRPSHFGKATRP